MDDTWALKYRETKEYLLIYTELLTAARFRGVVTYLELARLIGLAPIGNQWGNTLGRYLGTISLDEVRQNRPVLSAVTVTADGKLGKGSFTLAKDLGKLTGHDEEDLQ